MVVYEKYVALKCHFSSDYDYIKFNGKLRVTVDAFEKRRDANFFRKLAKKFNENEVEQFLLANVLHDTNVWIGDTIGERGYKIYTNWKKRVDALNYTVEQDLYKIKDVCLKERMGFRQLLTPNRSELPRLVSLMQHGEITFETFVVITEVMNLFPKWDSRIEDNMLYPSIKLRSQKYAPFLKLKDRKKFLSMIRNILLDEFNTTDNILTSNA